MLLAVIMVFGGLPLVAPPVRSGAVETDLITNVNSLDDIPEHPVPDDSHIYYSDLFYGYSYALNNQYLLDYYQNTHGALELLNDSFMNSSMFLWSDLKEALKNATDLKEWVKMIGDAFGLTHFTYNDALDAANVSFAQNLLNTGTSELWEDLSKRYGKEQKWVKKFNDIVKLFSSIDKKLAEDYDFYTMEPEAVFTVVFTEITDNSYFQYISNTTIFSLKEKVFTDFSKVTKGISNAAEILKIAKSLALALMIEDFRIESIDEILSTQSSGSMLYDGMSRLRYQLRNGFVSYFWDNYIEKKIIDDLVDAVIDKCTEELIGKSDTLMIKVVNTVIKIASWVVFDLIFDVPDIDDLTKQMVLSEYAASLFSAVVDQEDVFFSQFESQEVLKFERLFSAYVAATNAALSASDDIALDSNRGYLNAVKNLYGEEDVYSTYIDSAKNLVLQASPEVRQRTDYGDWIIPKKEKNGSSSIDRSLFGASETIENNAIYCNGINANFVYEGNSNNGHAALTTKGTQPVIIDGDITGKDLFWLTISEDTVLSVDNLNTKRWGEITVKSGAILFADNINMLESDDWYGPYFVNAGSVYIDGSVKFQGAWSIYGGTSGDGVYFNNTGIIIVNGDFELINNNATTTNDGYIECHSNFILNNYNRFTNNAHLVLNNFILKGDNHSWGLPRLLLSEDAETIIYGNIEEQHPSTDRIIEGTIILNGEQQQSIKGLQINNLIINNSNGIKNTGDFYVHGLFALNGNPIDNNGYKTYIYSTTQFDGVSNYGDLGIPYQTWITLSDSITANFYYDSGATGGIIIPPESNTTINGNMRFVWGKIINQGNLQINGQVVLRGGNSGLENTGHVTFLQNLTLEADSNYNYGEITMNAKDASISIGGDLFVYRPSCLKISNGSLIFKGKQQQNISNNSNYWMYIPIVVIDNNSEEGVVFSCPLAATLLFNHQQNHFTLEQGGTFVDYDGDGLLDNVDPYPTIGNPCTLHFQSNNTEFGSVSNDRIETIGGTEISNVATPNSKYEFSKWIDSSGATVSTDAALSYVARGDQTITAVFVKRKQPITTQTENGKINVVSSAEIDSEVAVTVTENAGYIFDEASLKYNGILIENNRFIMPDEPVLITAVFNRNDAYFALKDKIDEAAAIKYNNYSVESYANLTTALSAARAGLINHITEEESQNLIAMLQSAIDGLAAKHPVAISVRNTPVLYLGIDNLREQIVVTLTYDNNTTETLTDYEIDGFDCDTLGDQQLQISYVGISTEFTVTVQKRRIADCNISEIVDLPFETGVNSEQNLVITYNNGDVLTEGTDYEVQYSDNNTPGLSSVKISGKGIYEGSVVKFFNIICSHQIETIEDTPASCTEAGRKVVGCTICGAATEIKREYNDLPQSPHNYSNNMNATYTICRDNAVEYRLYFSAKTQFENGCDKLFIYNADDELIGTYTGTTLSGGIIDVNSSSVKLVLTTDHSVTYYGFSLDAVDVTYQIERVTVSPAFGHNYGDWISVDEAVHQRVCANDPTHVEIENHIWDNGTVSTAATCTGAGEMIYTCTICSGTKTESIPAINHAWGAWIKINDTQHQRVCKNDPTHIETESHSWDGGTVTIVATCSDTGNITYACTVCNAEKNETIGKDTTNHADFGTTIINATNALCYRDGYTGDTICCGCGSVVSAGKVIPKETVPHAWDDGTVTVKPTCKSTGTMLYRCTVKSCGAIMEKEILVDPNGHVFTITVYEPTCTESGYTSYACTLCRYGYSDNEQAPLGHDYVNHDAKAPTCTEIGWNAYQTCNRCDYSNYTDIAALGHDYVNHTAKAPTCAENGWEAYQTCSRCDYTTYEELNALGHDFGEWTVSKEPTCTEEGEIIRICKNDSSHQERRTIDVIAHPDNDGDGCCDMCGIAFSELDPESICPLCGKVHTGINGRIILFFHKLVLRLKEMFGAS